MASTVSNHEKTIVTNRTFHDAKTAGTDDECFDPGYKLVHLPYTISSTGHVQNGTSKTTINGATILTHSGWLGPNGVSKPEVGGENGGTKSHTWRGITCPDVCSDDLEIEGAPVVRSQDTVTVNNGNANGAVTDDKFPNVAAAFTAKLKDACAVGKFTAQCAHGRSVDLAASGYVYEVVAGDEVTLLCKHVDATDPAKPPGCHLAPPHPHWKARRTGLISTDTDELDGTTGYLVADDFTKDPLLSHNLLGGKGAGGVAPHEAPTKGPSAPKGTWVGADGKAPKPTKATRKESAQEAAKQMFGNAMQAWELFVCKPGETRVTVLGCAGAQDILVKVYPAGPFTFNLLSGAIVGMFCRIRALITKGQALLGTLGGAAVAGEFKVSFLENPTLTLEIEYKELTEEKNGFKPYQVRKSIVLKVGLLPLLLFTFKAKLPIANLTGPWGVAATKLAERFGLQANVYAAATFQLNISFNVTRDEYDTWTGAGFFTNVTVDLSFGIEIRATRKKEDGSYADPNDPDAEPADDYIRFDVHAGVTGSITFSNLRAAERWDEFALFDYQATIQGYVKASATLDIWGWDYTYEISWEPACLKYDTGVLQHYIGCQPSEPPDPKTVGVLGSK